VIETLYTHHSLTGSLKKEPSRTLVDSDAVLDKAEVSDNPGGPWVDVWQDEADQTWCVRVFLRDTNEFPTAEQNELLDYKLQEVVRSIL
jgi:hypothetical protein